MLHAHAAATQNALDHESATPSRALPAREEAFLTQIQRTHGNQAALRFLRAGGGKPLQSKCDCGGSGGGCGPCEEKKQEAMQRSALDATAVPHTGDVPEIAASSGAPIPAPIRARAEGLFNADFRDVRFHADAPAAQAAARVSARAFTVDNDIYFGAGWFRPETPDGARLIGHELAHVVQQRNGLSSADLGGPDDRYEQEADAAGSSFAAGDPISISGGGGPVRGRAQYSRDIAGQEAAAVGVAESPIPVAFLGEANDAAEVAALIQPFAATYGPMALIPDHLVTTTPPAAERPLLSSRLGRPLQRWIVAGCMVPGTPANVIGMRAHQQIQDSCTATAPGCIGEFPIPGDGRADLVRERIPAYPEIGEIKPASWLGRGMVPAAAAQLAGYITAYDAAFPGNPAVPMWSFVFPPASFILNPVQLFTAWGPAAGLYFYRCYTPRPPVPPPVTVPVYPRVPVPVTPRVTVPAPRTVPLPSAGQVGGAVATVGIGYLIYRGARMLLSAPPPLWWTAPANALAP